MQKLWQQTARVSLCTFMTRSTWEDRGTAATHLAPRFNANASCNYAEGPREPKAKELVWTFFLISTNLH